MKNTLQFKFFQKYLLFVKKKKVKCKFDKLRPKIYVYGNLKTIIEK